MAAETLRSDTRLVKEEIVTKPLDGSLSLCPISPAILIKNGNSKDPLCVSFGIIIVTRKQSNISKMSNGYNKLVSCDGDFPKGTHNGVLGFLFVSDENGK